MTLDIDRVLQRPGENMDRLEIIELAQAHLMSYPTCTSDELGDGIDLYAEILVVVYGGVLRYPKFQFKNESLIPVVCEINELLMANVDPWGVWSWWTSPNGWLTDGKCPTDLIGVDDETLLATAEALLEDGY